MKLVEDLGMRVSGSKGTKRRICIYECPECCKHFECRQDSVKAGRITRCSDCAHKSRLMVVMPMELVEDLGVLEYGTQGKKIRFGIYKCPECGKDFKCITANVRRGNTTSCRKCHNKRLGRTKANKAGNSFVTRAMEVHGDLYEYHLVEYTNSEEKVVLICKVHGQFLQTPSHHLNGCGCPSCAVNGFDKDKPAIMYYLRVKHNDEVLYKIGITNRTVKERFYTTDMTKITIIHQWDYVSGYDAYIEEKRIISKYKEHKYIGEPILSSGNTELFVCDVLGLDVYLSDK